MNRKNIMKNGKKDCYQICKNKYFNFITIKRMKLKVGYNKKDNIYAYKFKL